MKNPFQATLDVNNKVNHSPFDWSHQNNLTFNIGQIIPCFSELVPPGSKVSINPTFALQFMPMVFPVQTRMRAQLSVYKVPLRTLWDNGKDSYRNFVGNFKKGLVPPYIDTVTSFDGICKTGSLGDYLGIPTTIVGEFASSYDRVVPFPVCGAAGEGKFFMYKSTKYSSMTMAQANTAITADNTYVGAQQTMQSCALLPPVSGVEMWFMSIDVPSTYAKSKVSVTVPSDLSITDPSGYAYLYHEDKIISTVSYSEAGTLTFPDIDPNLRGGLSCIIMLTTATIQFDNGFNETALPSFNYTEFVEAGSVQDIDENTSPYYNSLSPNKDKQIMLSAYDFRAYEAIYNAYLRDMRNNPLIVDGEPEYNVWSTQLAGGADKYPYKIRYRNWEQDFLTTAVPSPQQGEAPLVGITTYNSVSQVTNDDGSVSDVSTRRVSIVDERGKTYGIDFVGDESALSGVTYTELSSDEKATLSQPHSLYDMYTSGISIADLRYVNAYQRYLEMNMRKNYSYSKVIEGHFDVKVAFDELLMPEFIGGLSQDVFMNSIVQTVETTTDGSYAGSLGSMSGNAGVRGNGHPITCYCDEECIIMALISVTPVPNYSQLLPKRFLHRDLLDSYYPEFDNLGFQPVTYREVCPIQAYNDNPDSLNDTFGYQRAWYEYVQKTDGVHGLFRTNLRNFLINRVFNVKPDLTESFLLVDPKQVNDVFSVTESSDKIFGQIWFDCKVNLPISRVSIPRLE